MSDGPLLIATNVPTRNVVIELLANGKVHAIEQQFNDQGVVYARRLVGVGDRLIDGINLANAKVDRLRSKGMRAAPANHLAYGWALSEPNRPSRHSLDTIKAYAGHMDQRPTELPKALPHSWQSHLL